MIESTADSITWTPAPVLQLAHAVVVKGGVAVLDDLTLIVQPGQHTAILGPNGAGKTTLINLLTRDDYPLAVSGGEPPVRIFGRDVWDVCELRTRLGIITADLHQRFVEGHSVGRITGADAVQSGFFATRGFLLYATVTDEMRTRAAEALERMDAGHLARRTLDEMSTGEARRVLIARALVTQPEALVLDEPTAGLDLVARGQFLDAIERLAQQGTTIIMVTHHVEEIVPSTTQVVLLSRGHLVAAGPTAEMLTGDRLSAVYGATVVVDQRDGYYAARRLPTA